MIRVVSWARGRVLFFLVSSGDGLITRTEIDLLTSLGVYAT
jgi:hypothetical protein